jgi:hypothetical protein
MHNFFSNYEDDKPLAGWVVMNKKEFEIKYKKGEIIEKI